MMTPSLSDFKESSWVQAAVEITDWQCAFAHCRTIPPIRSAARVTRGRMDRDMRRA